MASLQDSLAEFFTIEYSPDSWTDLLPKFIAHHVELYRNRVNGHRMDLALWQKSDQSIPAPANPAMPPEFVQACTEKARLDGMSFEMLTCTKFLAHEQGIQANEETEKHRQQSIYDNKLCGEAIQASMEERQSRMKIEYEHGKLQEAYKALKDSKNNNNMGQWLN